MPFLNGIEVATHLQTSSNGTKILFLTIHEEPEYISAALASGAMGYVTKRQIANDLKRGIREVFACRTFLSPSLRWYKQNG